MSGPRHYAVMRDSLTIVGNVDHVPICGEPLEATTKLTTSVLYEHVTCEACRDMIPESKGAKWA